MSYATDAAFLAAQKAELQSVMDKHGAKYDVIAINEYMAAMKTLLDAINARMVALEP